MTNGCPWVVPLGTSYFDFPKPIDLWKIIGNTLKKNFIIIFLNTFSRFHSY
jgi:hypothetical protein